MGFAQGEEEMVTIEEVVEKWDKEHPNMPIEKQGYGKREGEKIRKGKMYSRLNEEAVIKLSEDFDFEPWGNRTCYVFGFNYNNANVLYEIYIRFERRIIQHPNTDLLYQKLKSIRAESNLEKFTVSQGRVNPNHLSLERKLDLNSSAKDICDCMKKLIDSTQEKIRNFLTGKQKQEIEPQEIEPQEKERQEKERQEEERQEEEQQKRKRQKREQQEGDRLNKIFIRYGINDEKQREKCIRIHNLTKDILNLLIIEGKDLDSLKASYYTKKEIATNLLIKSKETDKCDEFRLYDTYGMNDPSEGKILLNFLEIKNENGSELPENIPFIACFSLEENSLNQFRLYGKEADNEATGVSIVFESSFFEDYELYRCVYIDREKNFKVSFNKEENDDKTQEIENLFKQLKELCENIEPKLLADLLIKILYLVKDSAFEEERECRIVDLKDIKDLKNKKCNLGIDGNRLYIIKEDTREIIDHIEKIYFAPLTEGMETFEIKTGVKCIRSLHPYRGKKPIV